MSTRRKLGSKQAYRVIHRPYPWSRSVPGWKAGLRRSAPTYGKRSALEACSRRCAIQIHNLLYFTLLINNVRREIQTRSLRDFRCVNDLRRVSYVQRFVENSILN